MTTKPSTTFEPVRTLRSNEFQKITPLPERALRFPRRNTPGHEWITPLEQDNYQIALIPFQATQGSVGRSPSNPGMDQLLVLPLTWKDLVTRVRMELETSSVVAQESEVVQFGNIRIDLLSIEVSRSGRPVRLSAMEFKVLKFFVSNPNRMISREELLNEVWGYNNYPCTRTVDNHLLRLRRKLEPNVAHPVYFRTVHGFGYRFTP